MTSPPGGQLKTRDRGPALSCFGHAEQSVNHEDRDSTALIHLLREAGRAAHLFPLFPHPSPRLAMDPPRYTLRGGASLSELWAGRGLLVAALDFATSLGAPPVPGTEALQPSRAFHLGDNEQPSHVLGKEVCRL